MPRDATLERTNHKKIWTDLQGEGTTDARAREEKQGYYVHERKRAMWGWSKVGDGVNSKYRNSEIIHWRWAVGVKGVVHQRQRRPPSPPRRVLQELRAGG